MKLFTKNDVDERNVEQFESLESQEMQGKLVECKYCEGTGKEFKTGTMGVVAIGAKEKRPCPACGGSGYQRV